MRRGGGVVVGVLKILDCLVCGEGIGIWSVWPELEMLAWVVTNSTLLEFRRDTGVKKEYANEPKQHPN